MIADVRFPIFVGLSPNQCSLYARATSFSVPTAGSPPIVRLSRPGRLLLREARLESAASLCQKLLSRTADVQRHRVIPYALQVRPAPWRPGALLPAAAAVLAVAGGAWPATRTDATRGNRDRNRHRTHERDTSISRNLLFRALGSSTCPVPVGRQTAFAVGKREFLRRSMGPILRSIPIDLVSVPGSRASFQAASTIRSVRLRSPRLPPCRPAFSRRHDPHVRVDPLHLRDGGFELDGLGRIKPAVNHDAPTGPRPERELQITPTARRLAVHRIGLHWRAVRPSFTAHRPSRPADPARDVDDRVGPLPKPPLLLMKICRASSLRPSLH